MVRTQRQTKAISRKGVTRRSKVQGKSQSKLQKEQARAEARYEAGLKALHRVEKGELLNDSSYHPARLYEHIAESRYGGNNTVFVALSIKSIIRLARSFKFSEWQGIECHTHLLDRAMAEIQAAATELLDWVPFWSRVNTLNPRWGSLVLLEITHSLWQGSVADLIDGVQCVSRGVLPKINIDIPDRQVGVLPLHQPEPPQNLMTPETTHISLLPPVASLHTPAITSDPISNMALGLGDVFLPNTLPDYNSEEATDVALWAKSQLSQRIKLGFQNDSSRIAYLHDSLERLDGEYLMDLEIAVSGSQRLDTREMKNLFNKAWGEMESSVGFQLERSLGLPYTVCLTMKVAHKGDYTLELKMERDAAMRMIQQFGLLIHFDPRESYNTSFT